MAAPKLNAALDLFQFYLQNRQTGVFFALVFQQLVRQQVDDPVIQHLFQCRLHHKLLQRSYLIDSVGYLISGPASRLDAFSVYPIRT